MIREKLKYFCIYSFIIRSIVIVRVSINIIDSSVETPLISPSWVIFKTCSRDGRVLLVLPDKSFQTRQTRIVNMHRLHRATNGN